MREKRECMGGRGKLGKREKNESRENRKEEKIERRADQERSSYLFCWFCSTFPCFRFCFCLPLLSAVMVTMQTASNMNRETR